MSEPFARLNPLLELPASRGLAGWNWRIFEHCSLVLVWAGRGTWQVHGGPEMPIQVGDVLVLVPGLAHRYRPPPPEIWHELVLSFSGSIFASWVDAGMLPVRAPVRTGDAPRWRRRFEAVERERVSRGTVAAACALQGILHDLGGLADHRRSGDAQWRLRVEAEMQREERLPIDLDGVAARLGLGYHAFRKRFRAVFGCAPLQYHHRRLMELAGELLLRGDGRLAPLAERFGCADTFHLSRCFRQAMGISPLIWREQALGPLGGVGRLRIHG